MLLHMDARTHGEKLYNTKAGSSDGVRQGHTNSLKPFEASALLMKSSMSEH
jgi:hypothetical protein